MPTALQKATAWSWCDEPNYRAPLRATGPGVLAAHAAIDDNGERFTATSAGTTTTTISSALTEATAAGYRGCLLRCVAAANAANIGVVVLVRGFDQGMDVLTHTAFPAATSNGDQFELVDVDVRVVETAGGSSAQVDSALRVNASVEPDDHWNNYYLVAENAANTPQGTVVQITDFVAASGRFVAALSGASAVGDLWFVRRFPKLWGPPTVEFRDEDLERVAARDDLGREQSVKGSRSWRSEWTLPIKGSGTAAGDGVAGVPPPELHPALRSVFATKVSTGDAVVAQSGTSPANSATVFNIATGGLSQFPVGSIVHDNAGVTSVVTATAANGGDPDSVTHRPGFSRTPVVGEVVRGGYSYEPQVTGHETMTLDAILGGRMRWIGYGGIPTVKIVDIGRGLVPKIVLGYQGGYWVTYAFATPSPFRAAQDTVVPRSAADCYVWLVAEGSSTVVRLIVASMEIDYGHVLFEEGAASLYDGHFGGRLVDRKPTWRATCWLDTTSPNDTHAEHVRYLGSQVFSLKVQHHQVPGRTWTWYAHRNAYINPEWPVSDGLHQIVLQGEVLASELASMPDCLQAFS
jgi:hypothetical protein